MDNNMNNMDDMLPGEKKKSAGSIVKYIFLAIVLVILIACVIVIVNPDLLLDRKKVKEPVAYEDIPFTSTDITSMEFALDGHVLTFPLTVQELETSGYKLSEEDRTEMIEPALFMSYYVMSCSASSEFESSVFLGIVNLEAVSKRAEDGLVHSVSAKDERMVLCNGISLASNYDEVIEKMGKPDEEEEVGTTIEMSYFYEIKDGEVEVYMTFRNYDMTKMEKLMLIDISY